MKQQIKKLLLNSPLKPIILNLSKKKPAKNPPKPSVEEVFTNIYQKGLWNKGKEGFCSGGGSVIESVTKPYIEVISKYLQTSGENQIIVDLGCGDMRVGHNFLNQCQQYIAVDIVPDLIEYHKSQSWPSNVDFLCLNIIDDVLPPGDICLIRQVFQHLGNEEILKILPKLNQYKVLFITEHYPSDNPEIIPNKNIQNGGRTRVQNNSGVYLDKPPFNLPTESLEMVLEVEGVGMSPGTDQGVIRTYKVSF